MTRQITVTELTDDYGWKAHVWQPDDLDGYLTVCGMPMRAMPDLVPDSEATVVPCSECLPHVTSDWAFAHSKILFSHTVVEDTDDAHCGSDDNEGFDYGTPVVIIPCARCLEEGGPITYTVS